LQLLENRKLRWQLAITEKVQEKRKENQTMEHDTYRFGVFSGDKAQRKLSAGTIARLAFQFQEQLNGTKRVNFSCRKADSWLHFA
jgi:hypothetical protein